MRTIGKTLAAKLGPLFPLMRRGPDVECLHCTRPILRGQTYFLKDDDVDGLNPVCTRCGITIEMACGRMTYAVARSIPRYGQPYPDRTDHQPEHRRRGVAPPDTPTPRNPS